MLDKPGSLPLLDLRMSHAVQHFGDIVVFQTWLLTDGDPCLVLLPRYRQAHHERVRPCVVQLSCAYLWDEKHGDPAYADLMAGTFAANLGLDPLRRRDVLRVQGIIRDLMHDLITIPVIPDGLRRKVADMLITDNTTGSVTHKEVTDYV